MEDKEIKKILEESNEGPSYGFSTKTMRRIEAIETSKTRLSIKSSRSVVGYLIPLVFIGLIISTFLLTDTQFGLFDLSLPEIGSSWISFNIHFSFLMASLAIAAGFWIWIWWEKKNFSFR
ncbi:hypothetical protein QYS49_14625 [Marivirga salinae]|uniref:Uncharacterized protein n=1 Tax=Marivirga salinarum TaxID=3059078 RepID=A0AA49J904_9BACT|nr:hypothetical protein [Marivirga sp. BDSF4-3]WKK78165.2 hypothetical protein QYS49_14625 [Marivirga sp. BDSF4-3]